MITYQEWDSAFFGYPVGRIDMKAGENFHHELFRKEKTGYHLIYLFSEVLLAPEPTGFIHADTKMVYEKGLSTDAILEKKLCNPFKNNSKDIIQLEKLALESGQYSRFKCDKEFKNQEFERLYKAWIALSIQRTFAKEILVYQSNNQISGFITIHEEGDKTARIGLMAVDPEQRGYGIGKVLVAEAEDFALKNGHSHMQVATQQINLPARSLYEKAGYKLKSTIFTYHYRNQ